MTVARGDSTSRLVDSTATVGSRSNGGRHSSTRAAAWTRQRSHEGGTRARGVKLVRAPFTIPRSGATLSECFRGAHADI